MKTRTSANADKVMVFSPGSDIAIANAICNYIIQNNLYDQQFLNEHIQFKLGTENLGNAFEDGYDKTPGRRRRQRRDARHLGPDRRAFRALYAGIRRSRSRASPPPTSKSLPRNTPTQTARS